jgi:hypothetical protein
MDEAEKEERPAPARTLALSAEEILPHRRLVTDDAGLVKRGSFTIWLD